MNKITTYIAARIAQAVKHAYSRQMWIERKPDIIQVLTDLSPDKPDDGTPGFLAYDVQGHDRMKMRTGRFLTRKLKLNCQYRLYDKFLPDTAIQTIAAQINTKLFGNTDEIRLDSGRQIMHNYENNIGGGSCMSGSAAEYTGLYADNPDKIKQLVMLSVNDSARAIVHVLDNGMYHMSRIYATSENLKQCMIKYAYENDWLYYNDDDEIDDKSMLVVSGLDYTDGEIPYADSLCGYRIEDGSLTMTHTANAYEGELQSTNGQLENSECCCYCDAQVSEDYSYRENGEVYCEDCYHEHFAYCEECDEARPADDCVWVASAGITVCENCLTDNYTRCDDCGEYFKTDDTYSVNGGDKDVCEDCLTDNYTRCDDCGEYFKTDDTYSVDDGDKDVCEDCLEDNTCCDNCGDYFSDIERADNGDYLCEDCLEDNKVVVKTTPIKDCEGQKLLPIQ